MARKIKKPGSENFEPEEYFGNECEEKYSSLRGDNWPSWQLFEQNNYNIEKIATLINLPTGVVEEIKKYYPWYKIKSPIFNIDVDNTYFNLDKFLVQMQQLYEWCEYDDFDPDLIKQYWQPYMKLHIDSV